MRIVRIPATENASDIYLPFILILEKDNNPPIAICQNRQTGKQNAIFESILTIRMLEKKDRAVNIDKMMNNFERNFVISNDIMKGQTI